MSRCLICLFIACTFIKCTPGNNKIPEDVLPVNKMKLIVWDLVQAGAYESFLIEKDTAAKNLNTAYLTAVLNMHKINKETFFKSFKFYQTNPALDKLLFDSVSAYAQRQRMEIYKTRQ